MAGAAPSVPVANQTNYRVDQSYLKSINADIGPRALNQLMNCWPAIFRR